MTDRDSQTVAQHLREIAAPVAILLVFMLVARCRPEPKTNCAGLAEAYGRGYVLKHHRVACEEALLREP